MGQHVLTFFWEGSRTQADRSTGLEASVAGQRIGYVRVSTLDQNEKRQLERQVLDQVFTDKASGRDTTRPELTDLLRFARDGDTWWCTAWTGWPATSMICVHWFRL
jgi:hypothetical protein